MNLDLVIFMISAVVAIFGATMMIAQRNPVASVLYFILSILAQAVIYIQLNALFLGAILVIVYAGAIMVLFLFVIMLLNLRSTTDLGDNLPPLGLFTKIAIPTLLMVELMAIVKGVVTGPVMTGTAQVGSDFGEVAPVARLLFTDYLYPFQLTGVLLLIAVVGAVVIARKEAPEEYMTAEGDETIDVSHDKVTG